MVTEVDTNSDSFSYLGGQGEGLISLALDEVNRHHSLFSADDRRDLNQILQILAGWRMPARSALAAIVAHLKRRSALSQESQNKFGSEVMRLAQGFLDSDIVDIEQSLIETRMERLRRLFVAAYTNLPLALLCYAAHITRMKSIEWLEHRYAHWLARDDEMVFRPLSEMLGLWRTQRNLADMSLQKMNAALWKKISYHREKATAGAQRYHEEILERLTRETGKRGITAEIKLRHRSAYGIYQRMLRGEALANVTRKIVIDVSPPAEQDCYQTLGMIHSLWSPVKSHRQTLIGGFFEDLIAAPKFNGYRAIVTTIDFPTGEKPAKSLPVEFRVFTNEMAQTNALGVIAAKFLSAPEIKIRDAWWDDDETLEFVRARPIGTSTEEIYAFSPIGELSRLPAQAVAIDYAYRVHSWVGSHCKSIWINGQAASFDRQLFNGDLVRIEVDANYPGPQEAWLEVVKTVSAKKNIRRALNQRKATPNKGKEVIDGILDKEIQAYELSEIKPQTSERLLKEAANHFRYNDLDSLYLDLANPHPSPYSLKPSPNQVVGRMIALYLLDHIVRADGEPIGLPKSKVRFKECAHQGRLCRVTPNAEILGRVENAGTRHEKFFIYRRDCPSAPNLEDAVALKWLHDRIAREAVEIVIKAVDRPRLLDEILNCVYASYADDARLLAVSADVSRERDAQIKLTVEAPDLKVIGDMKRRLDELKADGIIHFFQIDLLSPLEKMLLSKPDILPNPYSTSAARDPRLFKGRELEIQQLISGLSGAQNLVVLYGVNRIGKTSLLSYIQNHIAQEYDFIPVFVDLRELSSSADTGLWTEIATKIENVLRILKPGWQRKNRARRKKAEIAWEDFRDWLTLPKGALAGQRLLIMIDEMSVIDELWERGEALKTSFHLKSLIESQRDVAFIFCVQESLYKNAPSADQLPTWSALRAGFPMRLNYLDRRAAEQLITEPMGQMLHYDEAAVKRILEVTAQHPYYLQSLLQRIVIQANLNHLREIRRDEVDSAVTRLLDNGAHLFNDLLKAESRIERHLLVAIASSLAYVSAVAFDGRPLTEAPPSLFADESWPLNVVFAKSATLGQIQEELRRQRIKLKDAELEHKLEYLHGLDGLETGWNANQTDYLIRVPLFGQWLLWERRLSLVRRR